MSSEEHKKLIWDMVKPIKVGMLTTKSGEALHARPMHLVQDSYNGTIWFFTDLTSEKVFEANSDKEVCVTFSDHSNSTYVSLSGNARAVKKQPLIDEFWNPFIAAWFPEGKDAANVGLIEIKIHAGEHWDSDSSKLLQLFEIAKANITNEKPDMGENKKFGNLH